MAGKTPATIQLGKDGPIYRATVFKITSKNVRGVALTLELIEDEQTIHLEGGEEFLIAYVPDVMLQGDL